MLYLVQICSCHHWATYSRTGESFLLASLNAGSTSDIQNSALQSVELCRPSWSFLCVHPCSPLTVPMSAELGMGCRMEVDPSSSILKDFGIHWGLVLTFHLNFLTRWERWGQSSMEMLLCLRGDIVGGQPQVWGFCSSQNSLFSSFHLASVHGETAMACVCYKDQIWKSLSQFLFH